MKGNKKLRSTFSKKGNSQSVSDLDASKSDKSETEDQNLSITKEETIEKNQDKKEEPVDKKEDKKEETIDKNEDKKISNEP